MKVMFYLMANLHYWWRIC